MLQEQRHIYYDSDLKIEAYNLSGIVQKFPNHFHEYYVIGFIQGGMRHLCCKNKECNLSKGDFLLFNPNDNHVCSPINNEPLDYRAININIDTMKKMVKDITGEDYLPHISLNVIYQSDITRSLNDLYNSIISQSPKFEREENFFFLLEQVLHEFSEPFEEIEIIKPNQQIKAICDYMEEHFCENITLDDLLYMTTFGKSYLLRSFSKQIGVSPYRYLQNIRINKAKKFLEEGIAPIEVAAMSGFSDQSHFTNYFKAFIGLTPKQYQKIFTDTSKPYSE